MVFSIGARIIILQVVNETVSPYEGGPFVDGVAKARRNVDAETC